MDERQEPTAASLKERLRAIYTAGCGHLGTGPDDPQTVSILLGDGLPLDTFRQAVEELSKEYPFTTFKVT